jgi:hypothetical protein
MAAKRTFGKRVRRGAKRRRTATDGVGVAFVDSVRRDLGKVQTLAEFLSTAGALSPSGRATIVDQARIMIDQTYVHLPLKRAMHAIEPVQRLRLLKQRLDSYSERAFHNEMISIFVHRRDLHTNYVLPAPYRDRTAFLPFRIEECFTTARRNSEPVRQYIVTEVMSGVSDRDFKPGVVVTHWNGVPIDLAVEANADREAGSNVDARHLQGLQAMTVRWMAMSLPPDEEWVVVRYLPDDGNGAARETRFEWQVFIPEPVQGGANRTILGASRAKAVSRHTRRIGIDAKAEMQRRVRKRLFAPAAVAAQKKMTSLGASVSAAARDFRTQAAASAKPLARALDAKPRPARKGVDRRAGMFRGVDLTASSIMPDVIKQFGTVSSPKGAFGYIRLVTFDIPDANIQGFINEVARILALLPPDGLILDVRGNGGGYIAAGEGLLQLLTPGSIQPEPFHLINSPLTLEMSGHDQDLAEWKDSVREAVETGAQFSQGFPLTPPDFCNAIGQVYQGPVALIIDAGCYSTTDIFAAGFQDHGIGTVIGASGHTGAGGANVWEHADLLRALPPSSSPFKPVPGGASFRVAIRRSTRVGKRSGQPLEDLGVTPDLPIYRMTRNDLLNHNPDLIAFACGILSDKPRQRLAAGVTKGASGALNVTLTSANIQRVDVLVNGRPVQSLDVRDGATSLTVAAPPRPGAGGAPNVLECLGFRGGEFKASTRVTF